MMSLKRTSVFGRAGRLVTVTGMATALMGAVFTAAPVPTQAGGVTPAITAPVVGPNVNVSKESGNQSEGDIAVNPTNPQQVFAEANEVFTALMVSTSSDGGRTWSRRDIATGSDGLPAACCDGSVSWDSFGNLFLAYLDANTSHGAVHVLLSTDGGTTFTVIGSIGSGSVDQPTIRTGPGNAPGVGSAWVTFTDASNNIVTSAASVSGLGAAHVGAFSAPFAVPGGSGGDFGDISVGPAGQVVATWEAPHGGVGPANILSSTNPSGLSNVNNFGTASVVTATNVGGFDPIPPQLGRTIDAEPSLAWNDSGKGHTGRLYLAYTDSTAAGHSPPTAGSSNTDIFVRFSDDNGAHWSARSKVNDDAGVRSQFLPNVAVDQTTGDLEVSWFDSRNDNGTGGSGDTDGQPDTDAQFWGTNSTDGVTFAANFQISTGTSNAADASNGIDYGDYTHSAYFGGNIYAYWADNSNSTGDNPDGSLHQFDMYTAKIGIHVAHTTLTVTPSPSSGPGPLHVTYTYHETNDGTDPISSVTVTDNTCSPVSFVSGDTNNNGILDPGETWTFTCSHTFTAAGSVTNTATATGTDTVTGLPAPTETATSTITVTCDHTITGSTGALILGPGGTWCVQGANVGGSITIKQGASAIITNSTVAGGIVSTNAGAVSLCGDTVGGGVSISQSTGFVLIGDPGDDNCPGNTLKSSATLQGNTHGVEVISNNITGGLTVGGTSGTGPFPEDHAAEIESNHVTTINCSGNTPPPTSDGHPNTVSGAQTGQCAPGF